MSRYPILDAALQTADADAYLVVDDGDDSTQQYLSGFRMLAAHPTLYVDGEVHVLVPDLEYSRALDESDADSVSRYSTYDFGDRLVEHGRMKARALVAADFLADHDIQSVLVPPTFPNGVADVLREADVGVVTDFEDVVVDVRAVKTDEELDNIRETQAANETAMALVEEMLTDAEVRQADAETQQDNAELGQDSGDANAVLYLDGGVLTSERIRRAIEHDLLDAGCELDQCIVAAGPDAAEGHAVGSGPIPAGEPIVVDIFPRHAETRYFADMTRTFVKGDPSDQVREWYDLTRRAFDTALDMLEPGVTGEAVNDAVCDVFEDAGYPTLRIDESTDRGFTASTGHGVGLDVHERPVLSWGGGELEPGNVVTVEPGLYEPGIGGVRLEDLVVVTADGYENLTDYPRDLRIC